MAEFVDVLLFAVPRFLIGFGVTTIALDIVTLLAARASRERVLAARSFCEHDTGGEIGLDPAKNRSTAPRA